MRSVFLWRIIVILVITVLLASLLMTGGYMYLSRDAYSDIKLGELKPEAEAIGQLLVEYTQKDIELDAFNRILEKMLEATNTMSIVQDSYGETVYSSIRQEDFLSTEEGDEIQGQLAKALSGEFTQSTRLHMMDGNNGLSVCIPVVDESGNAVGAVFVLKSSAEIRNVTNRMSSSLVLAMVVVLPFMLLLSTLGARNVTEPLHKMSEVAIQMSRGDFLVRADENGIGEAGIMARALNNLCETLAQTIHQLRADKSQLKAIIASFSEGIAVIDSVGCVTLYNQALLQMFGAMRVGTRYEFIPNEEIWAAFDDVYRIGESRTVHHSLPNDRILWITINPVQSDEGERVGAVGLFKDMTEIENLERARRDYVQNISHELRTPLTAMRGLLEPLADGMVSSEEDRQRYYKIMLREVLRLSRLITDMMQLTRLQTGMEYMEFSEVNINEVLEDIHISYSKEASQREINFKLDAPEMPHVLTDPDRVEQLIVILLSNALRYTPAGGTITIKAENSGRVNISVIDTGTGISETDLPNVFDRFYTADKSRKEGNTGLGLSIAKQMIDKLGETIVVQSKSGEGTCFCFTLKKHVSNAIALGPAHDDWEEVVQLQLPHADEMLGTKQAEHMQDALFEVLPENKKEKPRRKKG